MLKITILYVYIAESKKDKLSAPFVLVLEFVGNLATIEIRNVNLLA
jgi:hypothetical protein